jgi:nucleoside-diphosphate-sugar epimerase
MERVLVTGGAGLLGRYVLDELEGKYHVLSYDLGPPGGGLCWHHIDPRDVARAFRLALESSYRGFDRFYLSAPSTLHPAPTLQLIKDFFGDSPRRIDRQRYTRLPYAPMFDTSHAEKYLGWNAVYDHRPALYGNDPVGV